MTDFTNNPTMKSDLSRNTARSTTEYKLYFAIIFVAALPICAMLMAYGVIRHMRLPEQGLFRMAWSEAHSVTPRLFWG